MLKRCDIGPRQIVLDVEKQLCVDKRELLLSDVFARVVASYCDHLRARGSPLIDVVAGMQGTDGGWNLHLLKGKSIDDLPLWMDLAICRVFKRFYQR